MHALRHRRGALALGFASVLPLLLLVVAAVAWVWWGVAVVDTFDDALAVRPDGTFAPPSDDLGPSGFPVAVFIVAVLVSALGGLVLFAGFLVHALADREVEVSERITWVILLFVLPLVGPPAYWYARIWRRAPTFRGSPGLGAAGASPVVTSTVARRDG